MVKNREQWGRGVLTDDRLQFRFGLRTRPDLPIGKDEENLGLVMGKVLTGIWLLMAQPWSVGCNGRFFIFSFFFSFRGSLSGSLVGK